VITDIAGESAGATALFDSCVVAQSTSACAHRQSSPMSTDWWSACRVCDGRMAFEAENKKMCTLCAVRLADDTRSNLAAYDAGKS
jgi:hypothetical protein